MRGFWFPAARRSLFASGWRLALALLMVAASPPFTPAQERVVVGYGSTWRWLEGTAEASNPVEAWRGTNFSDAAWTPAPAPFHYGEGLAEGTLLNNMRSNYTCVFLRIPVVLTNIAAIQSVRLAAFYDDGFVAWMNGTEIARDRVNGTPLYTSVATSAHEAVPEAFFTPSLSPQSYLLPGTNLLAVQAFNVNKNTSSDFRFDGELRVVWGEPPPPPSPPFVIGTEPSPGATLSTLDRVTVTFNEPVTGVRAEDLLVNGLPAAQLLGGSGTNVYTFFFTAPPPGLVQVLFDTDHGITDLEGQPLDPNGPTASWQYQLSDLLPPTVRSAQPEPGATVSRLDRVQITFSEPVAGVDAADLLVNGQPATQVLGTPDGTYTFFFPTTGAGTVQFNWADHHGIQDLAPASNAFAGASWTVTVSSESANASVVIHEFLAENLTGLLDEDGQKSDWIELRNVGSGAVNLLGWSLTDSPNDPGRWTLPAVTLNPGQYLLVFSSGKDRKSTAVGTRLHTNFRLNAAGDYLGLYNAEWPRRPIAEFAPAFPEQRGDVSFGLTAAGAQVHFTVPTPGAPNNIASAVAGVLAPPSASVKSGFFDQPFHLTLSTPIAGTEIRYTLDGSSPKADSLLYSGPLRIAGEPQKAVVLIRAAAFRAGWLSSRSITHSYIFPDHVLTQPAAPAGFPAVWDSPCSIGGNCADTSCDYEMDPQVITNTAAGYGALARAGLVSIPTLSIVTDVNLLFGPAQGVYVRREPFNQQPVNAEYLLPDGQRGFNLDCGLEIQGQTSPTDAGGDWKSKKLSLRLIFQGDFGAKKLEYKLFEDSPVTEFDTLIVSAGHNMYWNYMPNEDQRKRAQYVRDQYVSDLQIAAGGLAPRGRFIHLYLNGLYWGLHELHERPDHSFSAAYLGGDKSEYDSLKHDANTVVSGSSAAYKSMLTLARSGLADALNYERLQQLLDVPWLVDYLIVNYWVGNEDWAHKNWYVSRRRTPEGRFRFFAWDSEHVLKGATYDATTKNQAGGPTELFHLLRENPDFRVLFGDRVHRHFFNGGIFYTDPANPVWNPAFPERTRPAARYLSRIAEIDPAIVCESARWGDVGTNGVDRSNNPLTRNVEWINELDALLGTRNTSGYTWNFFPTRTPNVLNQFRAQGVYPSITAPTLNPHGGTVSAGSLVSMTMPADNVYFTTNGADPRVYRSGAISPHATPYTGPVQLGTSVVVKARAWSGGNWSALTEAAFTVGGLGLPLRITEIHYHPLGGDAFEFVEIQNVGALPLDLGGFTFQGISAAIAEGTRLAPGALLVFASAANPNAFLAQYPGVTVAGWFDGTLANAGERIALLDRAGQTITAVHYDDEGGWPGSPDGMGPSLEIIDPRGDPNSPANWRASVAAHGTPGLPPAAPPAPGAVVLNEIMADNLSTLTNGGLLPDWVELHNRSGIALSLADWSLSDDSNPRKFVFPPNTEIPAGGYLLVWCDTAVEAPGLHTGFALGRSGDHLFLYDASTNRVDALSFGLQLSDLSLGRVDGSWQLNHPTPGAANQPLPLASVTNLVINEWLANSPPGGVDWLELWNRSADRPVALQGLHVAAGEAVCQMPAFSFLAPGAYLQLFADELPGPNHLELKLPAAGGAFTLYDSAGGLIDRVAVGPQTEAVSEGRLPDGAATIARFSGSASPGASNYLLAYAGPRLNEVLARNRRAVLSPGGRYADFVELFNPGPEAATLAGFSLGRSVDDRNRWVFPAGTTLGVGSYERVWCDGERAPSTANSPDSNTGFSLDGESGEVVLFDPTGQPVDWVSYGFQVPDLPIGRQGGSWRLLASPTPGTENAAPLALGSAAGLRLNEWMATGPDEDWFEIHNPDANPVDLGGLYLTDDPAIAGRTNTVVAPLSFIAAKGFVKWVADGNPSLGRNHTRFSLDQAGESLLLYKTDLTLIDSVSFGLQSYGVSQGRLPDGANAIEFFPASPSPGESNYLPIPGLFINEVLSHTDPPLEDAIELFNANAVDLEIGGWYLSNSSADPLKHQVPAGTMIPAGGYHVFYEYAFNTANPVPFALSSSQGDAVVVSQTDPLGRLTGFRTQVRFDAAENGVSFGRFPTSAGTDFVPMRGRTFGVDDPASLDAFRGGTGLTNAAPRVGPVVMSEIFYHPAEIVGASVVENTGDEFLELVNLSLTNVPLYDPNATTNMWRVTGGIEYGFPAGAVLPPNGIAVLTAFDPVANPAALAAFRAKYSLPAKALVFGPFSGNLRNAGEAIRLVKPDAPQTAPKPDAGFVPHVLVEEIVYRNTAPWPAHAFGTGYSLQRRVIEAYGNEPLNWLAAAPNPGLIGLDADQDGLPDDWEQAHGLNPASSEGDDGPEGDPDRDGLNNHGEWVAGTHPRDAASVLRLAVLAVEPSGTALEFEAVAGRNYTLQSWSPHAGSWQSLTNLPTTAISGPKTVVDPEPPTEVRYYRLVTPALE